MLFIGLFRPVANLYTYQCTLNFICYFVSFFLIDFPYRALLSTLLALGLDSGGVLVRTITV